MCLLLTGGRDLCLTEEDELVTEELREEEYERDLDRDDPVLENEVE